MDDEALIKIEKALTSLSSLDIKPRVKGKNSSYALIVKNGFSIISNLLRNGLTFDALFDHFVEHDVLTNDGNPRSLRQAYRREVLRRARKAETKKYDTQGKKAGSTSVPALAYTAVPVTEQTSSLKENDSVLSEEERKELIRKRLGTKVDTGTSKIVRHSDGSFDFDD